jgi:hypothetical protein
MAKVFISGCVREATLQGPLRGLDVRASVNDGSERHVLWQGTTDSDGLFGFEVQLASYAKAQNLDIEVHHGRTLDLEESVAWHALSPAGTYIELMVHDRRPVSHGERQALEFPIGFPGANRPPKQRGPAQLELERPQAIPEHPMAALPFLLQRSRPTDPDEVASRGDNNRRTIARSVSKSEPP